MRWQVSDLPNRKCIAYWFGISHKRRTQEQKMTKKDNKLLCVYGQISQNKWFLLKKKLVCSLSLSSFLCVRRLCSCITLATSSTLDALAYASCWLAWWAPFAAASFWIKHIVSSEYTINPCVHWIYSFYSNKFFTRMFSVDAVSSVRWTGAQLKLIQSTTHCISMDLSAQIIVESYGLEFD